MKIKKIGLLPKVIIAIILGIACSFFFPLWLIRIFVTFNGIFGNFLDFIIPLIIIGLVAPGIAELGKDAGRLLWITVALAYGSTLISGFFSYSVSSALFPKFIQPGSVGDMSAMTKTAVEPYFTIEMPPLMEVVTALILAFVLGLGLAAVKGETFKNVLFEFRDLVNLLIAKAIIPLFPIYIFGIFMKICVESEIGFILGVFLKVIVIIFLMTVVLLLFQFCVAGAIAKKNPIRCLLNMMPAYVTALGTQSSAATIPVTLAQVKKNDVNPDIAGFTVPLCATIHLAGSILKIVACSYAILLMNGMTPSFGTYAGFIFMLGVVMVAAPGVPGGAIMAALGVLSSMLGFTQDMLGMIIAIYIAMDSFGTACNVTGDGAIALIVNAINDRKKKKEIA